MSVDIRETLKIQFDALNESFLQNLQTVYDLQRVFIADVVPGIADELGWDQGCIQYAHDWLSDTGK